MKKLWLIAITILLAAAPAGCANTAPPYANTTNAQAESTGPEGNSSESPTTQAATAAASEAWHAGPGAINVSLDDYWRDGMYAIEDLLADCNIPLYSAAETISGMATTNYWFYFWNGDTRCAFIFMVEERNFLVSYAYGVTSAESSTSYNVSADSIITCTMRSSYSKGKITNPTGVFSFKLPKDVAAALVDIMKNAMVNECSDPFESLSDTLNNQLDITPLYFGEPFN